MEYSQEQKESLDIANIDSFKNIGKDTIISLTSQIKDLSSDKYKETLEQYPTYATKVISVSQDVTTVFKELLNNNSDANDVNINILKGMADTIDSLIKNIDPETVSQETLDSLLDQQLKLADRLLENDINNKNFLQENFKWILLFATTMIAFLSSLFVKIDIKNISKLIKK